MQNTSYACSSIRGAVLKPVEQRHFHNGPYTTFRVFTWDAAVARSSIGHSESGVGTGERDIGDVGMRGSLREGEEGDVSA
jgi:hypothetical protein